MKWNLFIRKCLLIILSFTFSNPLVYAQHMHMDNQLPSQDKNIFLAMMDTMIVKMNNVPAGKSAEASFMLQMMPHHEGAIEMAKYEIQHGKNFTMIQLAKSILAEQTIEVQQMKLWLNQSPTDTIKTTALFQQDMIKAMNTMMQSLPENNTLTNTDRTFASVMLPHHQAAVDMAKVIIRFTRAEQTFTFAKNIISSQQIEIEQMSSFIK